MKLKESFFAKDTREVAKDLLGKYLVRKLYEKDLREPDLLLSLSNSILKIKKTDELRIEENEYVTGIIRGSFKDYTIPIFVVEDGKYYIIVGRITLTEAYKGMGKRDKKGILYPAGFIYLYPLRGGYNFNISTEGENIPACVLIAEVKIGENKIGQLNLVKLFKITKDFEGKSIEKNGVLWIDDGIIEENHEVVKKVENRVGIYKLWLL